MDDVTEYESKHETSSDLRASPFECMGNSSYCGNAYKKSDDVKGLRHG